jgi:signal transduction histidine kinase/ActR/RegA family two-component response regulator
MQVRHTLQLSAAATALFLIFIIIAIVVTTKQVEEAIRKGRSAETIVKAVFDLNSFTDEYLAQPGERIAAQWHVTHDHINQILADQAADTEESRTLLNSLRGSSESIDVAFANSTARNNAGRLTGLSAREAAQLKINAQSMVADATRLAELSFAAQERVRILADRILIGLTILFSLAAMGTIALLYRRIIGPLTMLQKGTERIAGGELSHQLDIKTHDEFGAVARSFNEMTRRLEELYRSLDKRVWAAEEVVKAQKEFIAVLSHELRNPLAALMSTVEVLQLENEDASMRSSLSVMHRQISMMRSLIDDLLEVSRVIRDKITLRGEIMDLRTLVGESAAAVRAASEHKKIQLDVSVPWSPLTAYADPVRITQVFGNILDNAIKFTPSGGRIEVRAKQLGSFASISIRDTGAGIRPEDAAVIFEAFVQAEHTADRRGLGLGLKVAKTLTELHGGTISVSSAGEGKGSEFVILLPLLPNSKHIPDATFSESASQGMRKVSCLIVDDDKDVANSFAKLLRHMGQDIRIAYSGEEAIRLLETVEPDLMFIDIKMPGMDGYELVSRIRSDKRFQKTKIVAITGYGQADDKQRTYEAGFSIHMTKPVDVRKVTELFIQTAGP